MAASCFSIVSMYTCYLRRCFCRAGLKEKAIDIDDDTIINFWGPSHSNSQKPSLVLIHGFGSFSVWQWCHQVKFFASNFNVYVPDLIFFGKSTTKASERSEIFQAESIVKLLKNIGVKKYSVLGTSYGGFVAYHMARMWPERVEKVVVASSAINIKRSSDEELATKAELDNIADIMVPQKPSHLKTLLDLALLKPPQRMPNFLSKDYIKVLHSDRRQEKLELLRGVTLGREERVNISPLPQEVLLLWGEHDKIFPLKLANELERLIGKNVKLKIIRNAGHLIQIERRREFNDNVKNFLLGSYDDPKF